MTVQEAKRIILQETNKPVRKAAGKPGRYWYGRQLLTESDIMRLAESLQKSMRK